MTDLTPGQRNRLVSLARAGDSLPWADGDEELAKKLLVRKFRGVMNEEFAHLTGRGMAAAQGFARR